LKSKIMAISIALALVLSLVFAVAVPVSASTGWNVSGNWVFNFLEGSTVVSTYGVTLAQTGTVLTGTGEYPTSGPVVYGWTITGAVTNGIDFTAVYSTTPSPGYPGPVVLSGTIALDGTMSGTWSQASPAGSGTWQTTSGHAAPTQVIVAVTGNVTAATVSLTYTNSPIMSLGMFIEGRNPATGWTSTGADYGNVTVTPGSDASPSWTVNAFSSDNSNGNFANGKMWCDALNRYLGEAMWVNFSLDGSTWGTYGQLGTGTSIGGTNLTQNFVLGAAQNVSHADVVAGQGNYYIYVQLTAGVTP
jgi:hypothetical protein